MKVLFVCTGNTCRSPMAEYYLNSLNISGLTASSAGLYANGEPISENSATVMSEMGIDASAHLSQPLTKALAYEADVIYCMSNSHKAVLDTVEGLKDKVFLLKADGISDPFGGDLSVYRKCRDEIITAVNNIFEISPFRVSYLKEEDAPLIAELERQCFSTPWSESTIKSAMAPPNIFIGVKEEDALLGYLSFSQVAGECYINNLAVHKAFRRRGIARALLCELMSLAVLSQYEFVSLEVRQSNSAAISLYSAFGFKEEGKRKNYYTAPNEDAVIMTRRF